MHQWSLGVQEHNFEFVKEFSSVRCNESLRKLFYLYIGYEGVCAELQKLWDQKERSLSNNKTLQVMNNKIKAHRELLLSIKTRIENGDGHPPRWAWNESDLCDDLAFNLKFEEFKNNHILLDVQPQVPLVFCCEY